MGRVLRALRGILLMRCPRCMKGSMYRGLFQMNEKCPVCGLEFVREPGYFTGAMYASYFLGIFTTLPVWLALLLTEQPMWLVLTVTLGELFLLIPVYFHYSRPIWIHIDYYFKPEDFERSEGVTARTHPAAR